MEFHSRKASGRCYRKDHKPEQGTLSCGSSYTGIVGALERDSHCVGVSLYWTAEGRRSILQIQKADFTAVASIAHQILATLATMPQDETEGR